MTPTSHAPLPPVLQSALEAAAFAQTLVSAEYEALHSSTLPREQFARQCMHLGASLALRVRPASSADSAISALLERMARTPALAAQFAPGEKSFDELTRAYAEHRGLDVAQFQQDFAARMQAGDTHK